MSDTDTKLIEEVNKIFYEALNNADLSIMDSLWLKNESVKCVHPGWPLLIGWPKIRESWENIFNAGSLAQVEISNVFIDRNGSSAWLNCVERLSYVVDNQVLITMAQTTNIFELRDSKWYMVLHHASPMPVPRTEVETETLQ